MKKLLLILLCLPMIGFGQGWEKTFGGLASDYGYSVEQTNDGGYIICGDSTNYIYIIKTNTTGNQQWSQIIGDGFNSYDGYSIKQTTDGGYIICGMTEIIHEQDYDIYLIKTDSQGNVTSTFNIPTPSSNRKLVKVVEILGRETKPQTNTPIIEIYDDGSVEKKVIIEK